MADDTRTGAQFRAWREGRSWTQAEAATALNVSRPTIARAELAADAPISRKVAKAMEGDNLADRLISEARTAPTPPDHADQVAPRANTPGPAQPAAAKATREVTLAERTHGRTSAECKAIRMARSDREGRTTGVPLIPLRPDWVTLGKRRINAAIPGPIDTPAPDWAGPRGVVGKGGVFDYETAHRMTTMGII